MQLILASSSPYRRELLQRLGLPFICLPPDIDESPLPSEAPADMAVRLAQAKAQVIAAQHPGSVVIGADQVATVDGHPIGKPGTTDKAREQLKQLSGQSVQFHSALCVSDTKSSLAANVITLCRFRSLSEATINAYLKRENVLDTAGSAKAEGLGITLMESISSDDPTAIIGLPLITLSQMLRQFGLDPTTHSCTHERNQ